MPLISASRSSLATTNTLHTLLVTFLISIVLNSPHIPAKGTIDHHERANVKDLAAGYGHLVERYVPEFLGLDRSIIGRAGDDIRALVNNVPGQLNIDGGQSQFWTFPKKALQGNKSPATPGLPFSFGQFETKAREEESPPAELKKRQDSRTLYISLNTCDQPRPKSSSSKSALGQLKLYISTSSSNQKPDADNHNHAVPVDGGLGSISITADSDVYFGVSAPSNNDFTGSFNYELTASIDDFFTRYRDIHISRFIDSDNHSVLVYTNEIPNTSINSSPLFSIYVHSQEDPGILGMQNSMCALQKHAQIRDSKDYETDMTLAGGGQPEQRFYVKGLNASSEYFAIIGIQGNSTDAGGGVVNGGGTVWRMTNFTTKSGPNCALIYNLAFCSEVAYAVPSNATSARNITALGEFYDNYASSLYVNFTKSLAQIPCNTTSSARYSLAVNCDDCRRAYKRWLCAVTIPRCQGFSEKASYLQPRAVAYNFFNETYGAQFADDPSFNPQNKNRMFMNSSRNVLIDEVIKPGPYKEVLPCKDLCYGLVQSCPAALGFACPLEGHGLNYTYGNVAPGLMSCNTPEGSKNTATTLKGSLHCSALVVLTMALWTTIA